MGVGQAKIHRLGRRAAPAWRWLGVLTLVVGALALSAKPAGAQAYPAGHSDPPAAPGQTFFPGDGAAPPAGGVAPSNGGSVSGRAGSTSEPEVLGTSFGRGSDPFSLASTGVTLVLVAVALAALATGLLLVRATRRRSAQTNV